MNRFKLPKGTSIAIIHGCETAYYHKLEVDMYTTARTPRKAMQNLRQRLGLYLGEKPSWLSIDYCDLVCVDI